MTLEELVVLHDWMLLVRETSMWMELFQSASLKLVILFSARALGVEASGLRAWSSSPVGRSNRAGGARESVEG